MREFRISFAPSRVPGHLTCSACSCVVDQTKTMSHVMWHEALFDAINRNPELEA
jgi:predicted dithiol-disulfide oxidoreductase (DUF899 family)